MFGNTGTVMVVVLVSEAMTDGSFTMGLPGDPAGVASSLRIETSATSSPTMTLSDEAMNTWKMSVSSAKVSPRTKIAALD